MPARKSEKTEFKKCTCGKPWNTRDDFLRDKYVKIIGYQPDFISRKYNQFLFQHKTKGCNEFLAVRSSAFADLRERACPDEVCAGKKDCPGYCMNTLDLRICSVACRNATDRELATRISSRRILRTLFPAVAPTGSVKEEAKGKKG